MKRSPVPGCVHSSCSQHLPAVPWEGAAEGSSLTFPAPASPWDPSAVPFKSHLLLLCPPALCKAVLQAPRLEGVGGVGTPKPPQVVPVGVTPTLSPLQPPAPNTAFKREAKRSAPASREELLCPREEQRSLCTFHPGCRFGRITQAQESSSRRGSRAPCAAVGWQQMFVTSGPPWRPRPRTKGSVSISPPQTPEPPKVPDWDMAPQGTLPLTRVSVSKWAALLHAHGMCFP